MKTLIKNANIVNEGKNVASNIRGEIEFRNVWFAYNYGKKTESMDHARSLNGEMNAGLSQPAPLPSQVNSEPEWVLKNISFKVKAGDTLALVGATGAGKSSIINLINRFYEINRGEIFVDGKRVDSLPYTAGAGARISIRDGVSFIGLIALPTTDLGAGGAVVLHEGTVQQWNKIVFKPALVIDSYNLRSETAVTEYRDGGFFCR